MPKRKIVFFLRSYNDVDHISPVIYKWLSTRPDDVDILLRRDLDASTDYRLALLSKYPSSRVLHMRSIADGQYFQPNASLTDEQASTLVQELFNGYERGLVAFDWVSQETNDLEFATKVIRAAAKRDIAHIALPHGDSPYVNRMIKTLDFDYTSTEHYRNDPSQFIAVPNDLCAKRYSSFMSRTSLFVLGSPRYSDEWMQLVSALTPEIFLPEASNKLKLCLFLRQPQRSRPCNIHWQEVLHTIDLIARFSNVHLVVKHHTRNASKSGADEAFQDLYETHHPNVTIDNGNFSSSALTLWADALLDIGTSAVFEAIKLGKPVLALEYLHANVSTAAHFLPGCAMRCRDDLYDTLRALSLDSSHATYSEAQRTAFVDAMLDVPDKLVLERYVDTLDGLLEARIRPE